MVIWVYNYIGSYEYGYMIQTNDENMAKLIVDVPDGLHKELKIEAAQEEITIKEIVIDALENRKKNKK